MFVDQRGNRTALGIIHDPNTLLGPDVAVVIFIAQFILRRLCARVRPAEIAGTQQTKIDTLIENSRQRASD
jgi:hypothetical protein